MLYVFYSTDQAEHLKVGQLFHSMIEYFKFKKSAFIFIFHIATNV